MHEPRIDRRSARTRSALRGALASLLRGRRYDEISVAEICNRAQVGRSTFYGHFADKDALKRDALEGLCRDLLAARAGAVEMQGDTLLALAHALIVHARDHRTHYRALAGTRAHSKIVGIIEAMLSDIVGKELAHDVAPLQRPCVARVIAAAYMAALLWWLDNDMPMPPVAIAALCREIISVGVAGAAVTPEPA